VHDNDTRLRALSMLLDGSFAGLATYLWGLQLREIRDLPESREAPPTVRGDGVTRAG